MRIVVPIVLVIVFSTVAMAQSGPRMQIRLDDGAWKTVADHDSSRYSGFQRPDFDDTQWKVVHIPHNWDSYEGYRRLRHGNRHGYAWYRTKISFDRDFGIRQFLWFEGVGSYATVWVNGIKVGYHAGGRTSFTIDITDALNDSGATVIAVRADHPPSIRDLPWVCGGCSEEVGFSEGSQPMGIFRPVSLIRTGEVKIEPFGVHIWNDTTVSEKSAVINFATEVRNYGKTQKKVRVQTTIRNDRGKNIVHLSTQVSIPPGQTVIVKQVSPELKNVRLWSLEDPFQYKIFSLV